MPFFLFGQDTHQANLYCDTCGETKFTEKGLSIWEFYKHVIDAFFNLDSKIWRTVSTLFTRSGKLTERYIIGDRKGWMKPMQFFAVVNLLFYLIFLNVSIFFTRVDAMNEGYLDYSKGTNYFHYNLGDAINKKSLKYAIEPAELSKEIELQANAISKAFLFF